MMSRNANAQKHSGQNQGDGVQKVIMTSHMDGLPETVDEDPSFI